MTEPVNMVLGTGARNVRLAVSLVELLIGPSGPSTVCTVSKEVLCKKRHDERDGGR